MVCHYTKQVVTSHLYPLNHPAWVKSYVARAGLIDLLLLMVRYRPVVYTPFRVPSLPENPVNPGSSSRAEILTSYNVEQLGIYHTMWMQPRRLSVKLARMYPRL